jgi:hypothetical protein
MVLAGVSVVLLAGAARVPDRVENAGEPLDACGPGVGSLAGNAALQ